MTTPWLPAAMGRLTCEKAYPYGKEWQGKFYAAKRVRPLFVEDEGGIVVVTVYVYYY